MATTKTKYKHGDIPRVYFCRSRQTSHETLAAVYEALGGLNIEIVKWEGGTYNAYTEEKRIKECDYMVVLGPQLAKAQNIMIGRGQFEQIRAFCNVDMRDLSNILLVDDYMIPAGRPDLYKVYLSEIDAINYSDPNSYTHHSSLYSKSQQKSFFENKPAPTVAQRIDKLRKAVVSHEEAAYYKQATAVVINSLYGKLTVVKKPNYLLISTL